MILIVYRRGEHTLSIHGHAGAGEPGHDPVCAAVSILAYTLADFVRTSHQAKQVKRPVTKMEPGDTVISCKPRPDTKAAVSLVFDAICGGFALLERDYPENIVFNVLP